MIQAFFRDELSEYEQALVEEHFRQHPELLEQYVTEKSWEDFDTSEDLAAPIADKMLQVISSATYKRDKIRRMVYRWASVAAVLLVAIAGYFLLAGRAERSGQPSAIAAKGTTISPDQEWRTDSNGTDKTLHLSLEDGSLVELSKSSRISYRKHFEQASRNIWLTGTAVFNVGKDKMRAFTVHTGALDVTALGTVFKISAPTDGHDRKTMEVRLLSGRIVVSPDSLLAAKGLKPIYLQPGEAILFDKQLSSMALSRPARNEAGHPEQRAAIQKPVTLAFNNESLVNIMDTLCSVYGLKAIYKQEQIKEMTFTGSYNSRKETLASFLNTLAMLYNLSIKQEKNTITLTQ